MADIKNYTLNFGPQHPAAHGVLRLVEPAVDAKRRGQAIRTHDHVSRSVAPARVRRARGRLHGVPGRRPASAGIAAPRLRPAAHPQRRGRLGYVPNVLLVDLATL